jgi:5'-nucleotidase
MNRDKPLILISNDDGVDAEGLWQLTAALRDVGDIVVFAPDGPRSGMSCAITTTKPVTCRLLRQEDGLTVYSCTGTPVDCVKLAVSEILPHRPDVLVAGINHGGNQGLSVHYSGTMGAAFEGCVAGIPSTGISMHGYTPGADFTASRRYARLLTLQLLKHGLPHGTYLNLNIPNIPEVKGLRAGRQTDGRWIREYVCEADQNGNPAYLLAGEYAATGPQRPDNDVTLLDGGYASLVPCRLDVTDNAIVDELKTWKL